MKVHILGHDLEVLFVPKEDPRLNDPENWGYINIADQEIYLNETIASTASRETLFHEILHAVDMLGCPRHLAENTIYRLSAVMYATLRDNPEVVKWLFEDIDDDKETDSVPGA